MSVIGLPVNLGVVADVAEKEGRGGRFSLGAVEVKVTDNSTEIPVKGDNVGPPRRVEKFDYRVAATDTKRLVMIEGETMGTDDVPGLDAVRNAPNSTMRAMVPAKEFKKVFADADKGTRSIMARQRRQVLTSLSRDVATFGFTDTEVESVKATRTVEGAFPPVDDIVAKVRKNATVKFAVDPKFLAELAKIAAGFVAGENNRLEILFEEDGKPLLFTATNGGQKLTMLLMPLSA